MKLETDKSYSIIIPETKYFKEEIKNITVVDKKSRVWQPEVVVSDKIIKDKWYYVYDIDRDMHHWYEYDEDHTIEEIEL